MSAAADTLEGDAWEDSGLHLQAYTLPPLKGIEGTVEAVEVRRD
jgi:hypothetical protein